MLNEHDAGLFRIEFFMIIKENIYSLGFTHKHIQDDHLLSSTVGGKVRFHASIMDNNVNGYTIKVSIFAIVCIPFKIC